MAIHLFHNELSTPSEECPLAVAVGHLRRFVDMLRSAGGFADVVLNLDVPVVDLMFGPNASLAALRNDGRCVEESLYLKGIRDRSPLRRAAVELDADSVDGYDYFLASGSPWGRRRSPALGLAHRHGGVTLSLPSHPLWESDHVDLEVDTLGADSELVTSAARARNACSVAMVERHCAEILASWRMAAQDGTTLWADRATLFPNLRFAPRVRAEIEVLLHGDPRLEPVVKTLSGLDEAVGLWRRREDAHPSYPFQVTGESERRKPLVHFDDGKGAVRCFENHARFTPGAGRIHFILETGPHRHALIGYVGSKIV